ncbi:hypothetical protein ACYRFS_12085 [Listeria kieliensis]
MSYKLEIELAVKELFKNAPPGHSELSLEQFNQQDVADTINQLSLKFSNQIEDSSVDYTGLANISFNK